MAEDEIQLPVDGIGKSLRTDTILDIDPATNLQEVLHQQVVRVGDKRGNLTNGNAGVLDEILHELQNISLLMQILTDTDLED